ncbi:orotidine-5'-phosphate decarboxylase [Mangrovibacillus cuniculi]|uniref:Orotidine 5'-phosphate decarboxylase n=1 Tax=Mangrovibacillus cuniculi TaxID=2593652 RepID=A0A7S8CA94_9BACI|nr:orotidine-5'-phosphate decarboxylase [Mangrovibacillus cuniculi]QPC46285.1 orotidine-5'-phosphate decarboxylase [Mangrovibacillus cuniculi]
MTMSIYLAVDKPSKEEAEKILDIFEGERIPVKIGMELFFREGATFIESLVEKGYPVFLDVKCHDIPVTIYRTMKNLAKLGVEMVNVHAAGGSDMMRAALEGLEAGAGTGKARPKLIAVTQLTSTSECQMNEEQGIEGQVLDSVIRYANLAHIAGLDGVVCSALECEAIRKVVSKDFLLVTPGIRFKDSESHDQKRIVTPFEAKKVGASHIVVGRPITKAANPLAAYKKIQRDWEAVFDECQS